MAELTPPEPDLTIEYVNDAGDRRFELTSPYASTPVVVRLRSETEVQAGCRKLGRVIADVAKQFPTARSPAGHTARQLNRLAAAGRIFLIESVLRDARSDTNLLCALMKTALTRRRGGRGPVPVIRCVVPPEQFLPWELLPLLNPAGDIEATNAMELANQSRAFLGFSAIIERRDPVRQLEQDYLAAWERRLRVRLVYDATYDGARDELGFFRARPEVDLEGPYPTGDPNAPSLAHQLVEPRVGVNGLVREHPDHVVHFACHCQTPERDDDPPARFRLAHKPDPEHHLWVEVDELYSELFRTFSARPVESGSLKPLVFLNACGTARMDPHGAAALLKPFHINGNAPIVGTAANVPDSTAAFVSQTFYLAVLGGASVGEALHHAKWQLLEKRGDPLGLLYSVHAAAGLRVLPVLVPN